MKKILLAVVLGLLLVAAISTIALADNGPHGGFNGSTEACASCHRAHSAVSSDGFLLVANDVFTLCTNCHDGTGAYTNVVDGFYDTSVGDPGKAAFPGGQGDANIGLFGGGFENVRMLTDYGNALNEGGLANPTTNAGGDQNTSLTSWARMNAYDTSSGPLAIGRAVTSTHDVVTASRVGVVWGSGNINAGGTLGNNWGAVDFTGATELECTSCHDPHGNAGKQGGQSGGAPYPSYRLLRFTPAGSNGFEVAGEVGAGTANYWNTTQTWSPAVGTPFAGTAVVPSTAGVLVPDRTIKWYSVNNDITRDPSLAAYRARSGPSAPEIYVANFAGQGDYGGRYYAYRRPSTAASLTPPTPPSDISTYTSCPNGSGVPTNPVTACGAATGTAFNNSAPHDALGFWCSTCHDRYLAPGGASRTTDSGDPGYHFRHRAAATGATTGTGTYTCVDCHNAHGTASTANALAGSATYAGDSALLKADNRAICTRCHAAAVNFFNVSTSPTAPMIVP